MIDIVEKKGCELVERQRQDIWELLVKADGEFVPPLSQRESTVQQELDRSMNTQISGKQGTMPWAYFEVLMQQEFLLACEEDKILGFMSYIPNNYVKLQDGNGIFADYVSTIIVHPDYRARGITGNFYRQLFGQGKENMIVTRTWSTNYAHLHILHKLGFQVISVLKDDRGIGIDTVYMAKSRA